MKTLLYTLVYKVLLKLQHFAEHTVENWLVWLEERLPQPTDEDFDDLIKKGR